MAPLPAKRNNPTQASNAAKKRKNDGTEPEIKGEFETKLANFGSFLMFNIYKVLHFVLDPSSQASTSLAPTQYKDFKNSRQVGAENTWPRPPVDHMLQIGSSQSIPFQLVDLDYIMDRADVVVRLFGVTKAGNSICASVQGYRPYFYASTPAGFGEEHIANAIKMLNDQMKTGGQSSYFGVPADITSLVTDIELVQGTSLYNYSNTGPSLFLKIYVVSPRLITSCNLQYSKIVEPFLNLGKNSLFVLNKITGGEDDVVKAFEANLDFEVRFMADLDIVGCGWVELLAHKYYHVPKTKRATFCQLEVNLNLDNLIVHSPTSPEWSGIAPLRTLSFDIECLGRKGIFPEATHDPIIQIASMVKIEGESEPFIRNCFVTGSCTAVMGSDIIECESETELLEKWAAFIRAIDSKVSYLSRVKSNMCRIRDASLQSKQMGNRVNKLISMEGRIVFDVLQLITRDYKLRSYTLNNVSYHFLSEQKEDVDYNYIPYLQNGTAGERRRLAVYCMKDAYLPLRLLDKLMLVINYIEMARVTGVPISFLVFRGQQVKILSQLVRKTRQRNIFLPVVESAGADNETYEGATVIEPMKGYYQQPIATLDFASLYPSIMIAHNLCYTTLLSKPMARELVENEDYVKTPSGDMFVKNHLRRGILPEILEDLLSARKKAKTDLKSEKDPFRQMVLNGRQMALKISANSVYGFTGATVGKLPCLSISQSVTSFGREMIDQTKNAVESYYKKGAVDGKCPIDAQVIYGDTDSVMVKFGVDTVAEAMELGQHAATNVSQQFIKPIKLEFEKVYYPYLLINKKRYAGLYYTRPDKYDKMDCKGLETVRRDNCPLVVNVLNVCLEKLMIDKDKDGAIAYAKRVISDLLANRIDISMLIISKELTKKGEKYTAKQAHVELAERMRKRDPGSAPRLGDRVPYVIVAMTGKVSAYEKAEDPIYVLKNEIPIDTKYYLEHQLKNPLERLFDPIFLDKSANVLFTGDHTKKKTTTKSRSDVYKHTQTMKRFRCNKEER
ncbi:DNA polymerase family B domain-containing protein [Ditylenchus destructor]|nr:DNA polymerase family B domain-containing protein [Ditylenchus destructor]